MAALRVLNGRLRHQWFRDFERWIWRFSEALRRPASVVPNLLGVKEKILEADFSRSGTGRIVIGAKSVLIIFLFFDTLHSSGAKRR
jgi:hypothetical protein